jgi:hypothetical protein
MSCVASHQAANCLHVQTAVIAATAAAVGLLGIIIAKKRSGESDEDIKADLKRSVRKRQLQRFAHAALPMLTGCTRGRVAVTNWS